MDQVLQIIGALLILLGFWAGQAGRLRVDSYPYLWVNLGGSVLLFATALIESQWGFVLLEGAWALISTWGLRKRVADSYTRQSQQTPT
ncbi:MAG TPA: hypothetical protein VJU79_06570 [Candidatus Dormibacteraeota bacterium]|nr:hypothetical protein [Candidatus Dormibacteraeota bacterium]